MTGVELIAAERERQHEQEGYDAEHDDLHGNDLLALAAAVYALPVRTRKAMIWNAPLWRVLWPAHWPFKGTVDLQSTTHPRDVRTRELAKAGALCAAEIDRLQRGGESKA